MTKMIEYLVKKMNKKCRNFKFIFFEFTDIKK